MNSSKLFFLLLTFASGFAANAIPKEYHCNSVARIMSDTATVQDIVPLGSVESGQVTGVHIIDGVKFKVAMQGVIRRRLESAEWYYGLDYFLYNSFGNKDEAVATLLSPTEKPQKIGLEINGERILGDKYIYFSAFCELK